MTGARAHSAAFQCQCHLPLLCGRNFTEYNFSLSPPPPIAPSLPLPLPRPRPRAHRAVRDRGWEGGREEPCTLTLCNFIQVCLLHLPPPPTHPHTPTTRLDSTRYKYIGMHTTWDEPARVYVRSYIKPLSLSLSLSL
jgi:hypothetical protein